MTELQELGSAADWEQSTELCVSCPDCAFTFDSAHTDADGGYSCPVCVEIRLEARIAEVERERDYHARRAAGWEQRVLVAEARVVELEGSLRFWVDRADHFDELVPEERAYVRARGVLTPAYKLGRALAATDEAEGERR